MWGLIFLTLLVALFCGFGLWIAAGRAKTSSPAEEEKAIMKKTQSVADLKGMFKANPGVHISIEEMQLGYDSEAPWRVSSLVMTEPDRFLVRFKDCSSGVVRFEPSFYTGVFEPLKYPAFFKQVFIESGTVTWPGGIDLASEAMHDEIEKHGEWVLR